MNRVDEERRVVGVRLDDGADRGVAVGLRRRGRRPARPRVVCRAGRRARTPRAPGRTGRRRPMPRAPRRARRRRKAFANAATASRRARLDPRVDRCRATPASRRVRFTRRGGPPRSRSARPRRRHSRRSPAPWRRLGRRNRAATMRRRRTACHGAGRDEPGGVLVVRRSHDRQQAGDVGPTHAPPAPGRRVDRPRRSTSADATCRAGCSTIAP